MAQYSIDRVLTVAGTFAADNLNKGVSKGDVAFLADQVVEPSLSFLSETEDIVDATNNVIMSLQGPRGAKFSAQNAFFNTNVFASQLGTKSLNNVNTTYMKYDILTTKSQSEITCCAYLSNTPALTNPSYKDFKVYVLNSDNSLTTAQSLGPGQFVYTKVGNYISMSKALVPEGSKVLVVYMAKAIGEDITVTSDAQNELLNVTVEVLLRELCNEELYYAFIIIKGKLSGETEWSMTRDGKHSFEINAVPSYCDVDKKLVEVIIVDGEDL